MACYVSPPVIRISNEIIKGDEGFSAIPKQVSNVGRVRDLMLCEVCISTVTSAFNMHVLLLFSCLLHFDCVQVFSCGAGAHSSTLELAAVCTSETYVKLNQTIRRNIAEDTNLHILTV
jgi:hypothetical protein